MMKKQLFCLVLALVLALALAGCGGGASSDAAPKDYTQVLRGARSDELNEILEVTDASSEDPATVLEWIGLDADALEQYAISISFMNTQAYGVMIVKPKDGKAEEVKSALQDYIQRQTDSFEFYLADQYEIAKNAKLETMPSGEVVLVMCEDAPAVLENIQNALK